jgi:hypothetical protein
MIRPPVIAFVLLTAASVLVGGCGSPGPTPPASSGGLVAPVDGSDAPAAALDPAAMARLGGAWQARPVALDDAHVAIVSDACAAKARTDLGETEANLPTALVDARGEGLVSVIMADDLNATLCLARFDATFAAASVISIDRLTAGATAALEGSVITLFGLAPLDDRPGGRTFAIGRIGSAVTGARVQLADGTAGVASTGDGWWTVWWPGSIRAKAFEVADASGAIPGAAMPPAVPFEARTSRAHWWIDPAAAAPTAGSRAIHALVLETACAGGAAAVIRADPPVIDPEAASVTVTIDIRRQPGVQACGVGAPFPLTINLPEPLGARALLDGGSTPPRDASKPPAG